jgi:hypothetical protein
MASAFFLRNIAGCIQVTRSEHDATSMFPSVDDEMALSQ